MVRDISEMTEDEIMDELNLKYGIDSIEELNDKVTKLRNELQPVVDFMVSWCNQFQEAMIELWNAIPDEMKEAIAEYKDDNPESEEKTCDGCFEIDGVIYCRTGECMGEE